jgi:hypothetical protein
MTIPSERYAGLEAWNRAQYILHIATLQGGKAGAEDDETEQHLSYGELRVILEEKNKTDKDQAKDRLKQLEQQVEEQRKELHKLVSAQT